MTWIEEDNISVERVWSDAKRILSEIGLEVANDKIAAVLQKTLPAVNGRIQVPPDLAEHYADEIRRRFSSASPSVLGDITIRAESLNVAWLDPADNRVKPMDTPAVVRNTRLIRQCEKEGSACGGIAGIPQDVPPEMQFIQGQYLNCLYNPGAGSWGLILSEAGLRYLLEISRAMGHSQWIGTQLISPLRFMGQSNDLAFAHLSQLDGIITDPMPVLGVTAPADLHAAWAQSVAENIASYSFWRICGCDRVEAPSFRLFAPNPSTMTIWFSSPRHLALLVARRKIRAFFGLSTTWAELLLVASKVPDAQAAAEKTAGMVFAQAKGFTDLEGAGGLWLDEIFSPQQLIIDIEIKNMVIAGAADIPPAFADAVEAVKEGVQSGNFLATDLTADRLHCFTWNPSLFNLRPRGAWTGDDRTILAQAARIAQEKADAYTYELSDARREKLDRIMASARREFCA
jgi:trimethylamine:corrinoid methyltransferase-like protein